MKLISTTLITLFFLFGCSADNDTAISFWSTADPDFEPSQLSMRQQYERIEKAKPELDAEEAYEQKDVRYFAVMGFALTTPGVNPIGRNELKVISWTSDAIENDFHMKLNRLASDYAKRYNLRLRELKNESAQQNGGHNSGSSAASIVTP